MPYLSPHVIYLKGNLTSFNSPLFLYRRLTHREISQSFVKTLIRGIETTINFRLIFESVISYLSYPPPAPHLSQGVDDRVPPPYLKF